MHLRNVADAPHYLPQAVPFGDCTSMPQSQNAPRKKLPKELAVIDADNCTGCGACVEVCPAGCIVKVEQHPDAPGMQSWCEVDWDRCIGCKLCIRAPRKKSDPYTLAVCPWGAIEMVPVAEIVEAVERIGGPPQVAKANRRRLLAVARRQVRST